MDEYQWRKVDRATQGGASCLSSTDICFFYMDRLHGGYDRSKANQRIVNFKKKPEHHDRSDWKYKKPAIHQFAHDLTRHLARFKQAPENAVLIAIPTSRRKDHPFYDDRLVQVIRIAADNTGMHWADPFDVCKTVTSSHAGGTRKVSEISSNLRIADDIHITCNYPYILLIDDVITTGAHYIACKNALSRIFPHARIAGLFWAKQLPSEYDYHVSSF